LIHIAPNFVSIRDVSAEYTIFSTHKFIKGPLYHAFDITGDQNVVSARDPALSKFHRKLTIPMFTHAAVDQMEEMILNAGVYPLIKRLEQHAKTGEAVNLMQLFHYMTFVSC
jgi:cytochrome P450